MTEPPQTGGAAGMRGYLVQTVVALLDMAQLDPPFITITLEPAHGDDQFDYVCRDAGGGVSAVQVKSTNGEFTKKSVEAWAKALQAANDGDGGNGNHGRVRCELILVGNYHTNLAKVRKIGAVTITKKNLDLPGLYEQAKSKVADFMYAQAMPTCSPDQQKLIVSGLIATLAHYSTTRAALRREELIALLHRWIVQAPRQARLIDISRIVRYAPAKLIGRESETALLAAAWDAALQGTNLRPRILCFVALGGEGKTSLVAKWASGLAQQDWPGCDAVFAWSFYSQGSENQVAASADLFINEALIRFGDVPMATSSRSGHEKGQRLAELVGQRRALLVLDGLEPLQYAPTSPMPGELKDQGLLSLLNALAAYNAGLCILTTRYTVPDLRCYHGSTVQEHTLARLSTLAGGTLLRALGVKGMPNEFDALVEQVKGHALTLNLLGSYIKDAHGGDIRKRDLIKLEQADNGQQGHGGHAFRVMDAYSRWFSDDGVLGQCALAMLRLLGFFDRPASGDCIAALLQAPIIVGLTDALQGTSEAQHNIVLARLEAAKLLTVQKNDAGDLLAMDAHPLLREYFARTLQTQQASAWQAAHQRLFEHLCDKTKDKMQPTLEDLQPLYQAVAHGCLAGLHQRACYEYRNRIVRKKEYYSTRKLGAFGTDFGALACFFTRTWDQTASALTKDAQAWLLNEAAHCLRGLGRLREAVQSLRAALAIRIKEEDWKNAAHSASNLSELELTLGDLEIAVPDGEQALIYAERSGDAFMRVIGRTAHADTLYQCGERKQTEILLREAEALQAADQPQNLLLYSLRGFLYCDLLLALAERSAWKCTMQVAKQPPIVVPPACHDVAQRAAQTLQWVSSQNWLRDIALDHLTLGRTALYIALLSAGPLATCQDHLQHALDGLRRAGTSDHLPRALLTRAWLRFHAGTLTGPASAQADLDEAWQIAARGPMPLFMADIHLTRARLFARLASAVHAYPSAWHSPAHDLREARRLIEKHGYWRRKEELEDAEAAILPPHRTT